jgi:pimeloyl-ACP methyl ester carboxylesterase
MRRVMKVPLVAGGALALVAGGALARSRLRGRGPAIPKPVTGIFPNGMAYVRWGTGPKTLLFIPGGPGNAAPDGMSMRMLPLFGRLVEDGYTAWYVARRRGMPEGHTIADMADDYAALIADEFGGRVDLVVGVSYGGMIGFYLAARHPERFGHIAIAVAGYEVSEQGKTLDYDFARLLSEGRNGEAGALMVRHMAPGLRVPGLARVLGAVMGRIMAGEAHASFASDVMVEAEAEVACDARDILPAIPVPVLLVCGDDDLYFPKQVYEETARLIPDGTLRMYEGVGHVGAIRDRRLSQDVLEFVRQRPTAQAERDVELRPAAQPKRRAKRRTGTDQPAAATEPPAAATEPPAAAAEPPATPSSSLAGSSRG